MKLSNEQLLFSSAHSNSLGLNLGEAEISTIRGDDSSIHPSVKANLLALLVSPCVSMCLLVASLVRQCCAIDDVPPPVPMLTDQLQDGITFVNP